VTEVAAPQAGDRIVFAGSEVSVPPLAVGTWAWGDKSTWGMGGYDSSYNEATIRDAWQACLESGVVFFDTAEGYGGGESERIIGRLVASEPTGREKVVIATTVRSRRAPMVRWPTPNWPSSIRLRCTARGPSTNGSGNTAD
jgi:aryl-alcohol dehydrogenase-like predicted oxidoreductase